MLRDGLKDLRGLSMVEMARIAQNRDDCDGWWRGPRLLETEPPYLMMMMMMIGTRLLLGGETEDRKKWDFVWLEAGTSGQRTCAAATLPNTIIKSKDGICFICLTFSCGDMNPIIDKQQINGVIGSLTEKISVFFNLLDSCSSFLSVIQSGVF